MDWQIGDLALCVRSTKGEPGSKTNLVVGKVYTVANTQWGINHIDYAPGVGLKTSCRAKGFLGNTWLDARAFIKVTPPADMENDLETVDIPVEA